MHGVDLYVGFVHNLALVDGEEEDIEEEEDQGEGTSENKDVGSMVRKGSWHSHINQRSRDTEVSLGGKAPLFGDCLWFLFVDGIIHKHTLNNELPLMY